MRSLISYICHSFCNFRVNLEMASLIVCVLKAKDMDGNRGLKIAIDYKYVNKFTEPSVAPLEDINDLIQQVGASNYMSLFDVKSGYHQCIVREEDK